MRRFLLPLLFVLTGIAAHASGAYVAGTISGTDASWVRVRYYRTLADVATHRASVDSAPVGAAGRYLVPIAIVRPTLVEVYLDGKLLTYGQLVRPGDTLIVDW